MPKKTKVQVEVASETKTTVSESLLQQILDRLDKIEAVIDRPITSQVTELMPPQEQIAPEVVQMSSSTPIPDDYRVTVDNILNKDFGIELEIHKDAPVLTLTIVVPEKYSQMTPSQREILHRDIRPKVITTAGGVAEVKEWAETVFKNLNPEIQAMVVSDRMRN